MRKTVLVTGSSSGIGKEIARILAKDYDIILHYNSNENSTRLLKEELNKEKEALEKKSKYLEDEMLRTSVLTKQEDQKVEEKPVDKVVEKLKRKRK